MKKACGKRLSAGVDCVQCIEDAREIRDRHLVVLGDPGGWLQDSAQSRGGNEIPGAAMKFTIIFAWNA
jgi:hypothetical protein